MEITKQSIDDFVAKGAVDVRVPTIEEACLKAQRQIEKSFFIGERKTPAVSFWPITLKKSWVNFGNWWTLFAPDGDVKCVQRVGPVEPLMMQLFYIRIGFYVMQLAWERPDIDFRASRNVTTEAGTMDMEKREELRMTLDERPAQG